MRRRPLPFVLSFLAGVFMAAPVLAAGYWNVPSTFCQCMGHGCGAGYHAPLILGPSTCDGWLAPNEIRLPYAPSPTCVYGHGNRGGSFYESSALEPAFLPPAGPLHAPTPALHHAPLRR